MKKIRIVVRIYLSGKEVDGFTLTTSASQNAKAFKRLIVLLHQHLAAQLVIVFSKYQGIRPEHMVVKMRCGDYSHTVLDNLGVIPMNSTEIDAMLSNCNALGKIQGAVLDYVLSTRG